MNTAFPGIATTSDFVYYATLQALCVNPFELYWLDAPPTDIKLYTRKVSIPISKGRGQGTLLRQAIFIADLCDACCFGQQNSSTNICHLTPPCLVDCAINIYSLLPLPLIFTFVTIFYSQLLGYLLRAPVTPFGLHIRGKDARAYSTHCNCDFAGFKSSWQRSFTRTQSKANARLHHSLQGRALYQLLPKQQKDPRILGKVL